MRITVGEVEKPIESWLTDVEGQPVAFDDKASAKHCAQSLAAPGAEFVPSKLDLDRKL